MKAPLHISKISPPRLSRILYRSRLIQRLEENQDKNLILILGQAAQGKSTLTASYAQKSETPWAWMNLGIENSDPVSEKAYQRLMTLYSNRGMRSAALKVYEECRQALQTGLDTATDEVTTSIYRKVLET